MELKSREDGDITILTVTGDLVIGEPETTFKKTVTQLLEEGRVNLLVELPIGPPLQPSSKIHGVSVSVVRMRPTARTIFSHLLVSATSFARPARVSL